MPLTRRRKSRPVRQWRKRLTVASSDIPGNLTNFPVCLQIASDAEIANRTLGDDIYITTSDGRTTCPHEIEFFDPPTGEVVLWFEAPTLSSSSDTDFYLYYGDGRPNSENPNNVWDANHVMVQHFAMPWTPDDNNPVFDIGGESANGYRLSGVVKEGSTWDGYYTYDISGSGTHHIGHATSTDGINWTDDTANNPVVTHGGGGSWDEDRTAFSRVWKEGSTYYMLYTGASGSDYGIGLATSSDKTTWSKEGTNPVLDDAEAWADEVETGAVFKVGTTYYMFYNEIGAPREVGLATSSNLTSWSKDGSNPLLTSNWFIPDVIRYGSYYYMFVHRYTESPDFSQTEIFRDTSPDFTSGSREFLGVARMPSSTGNWEDGDLDGPILIANDIYHHSFSTTKPNWFLYILAFDASAGYGRSGLYTAPQQVWALKGAGLDSTSNGHNADTGNQTQGTPGTVKESVGGALEFAGAEMEVIADHADFSVGSGGEYTIELIITPDVVTGTDKTMWSHRDNVGGDLNLININGSTSKIRPNFRTGASGLVAEDAGPVLVVDTTYQVCLTRDSSGNFAVWVNGTEYTLTGTNSGAIDPDQNVHLGVQVHSGATGGTTFYDGTISEVRFSDTIRSDDWLTASYNFEVANTAVTVGNAERVK